MRIAAQSTNIVESGRDSHSGRDDATSCRGCADTEERMYGVGERGGGRDGV